jgi:putative phosphoesterase
MAVGTREAQSMTVGVMSDTHTNVGLMNSAADLMIERFGVTKIYHLGDDYEDSCALLHHGIETVRVPGIYDREYGDSAIPRRVMDSVSGMKMLVAHAEKTLPANEVRAADIVLAGHTHLYEIRDIEGAVLFNPGHLKGPSDKGRAPTFGIIEIGENCVRLTVCDLNGEAVETRQVKR